VARTYLLCRLSAALLVGAFATVTLAPAALAQDAAAAKPDKKTRDAARKAYGAGEKAYDKGDYAAAFDHFKKANELIPSPHAEYWMGMTLYKQGKNAEAVTQLEKFLAHPGAAKVGDERLGEAKKALEELQAKLGGELNLVTTPAGATVMVDGQAQKGETPMVLKLKPGAHKVAITSSGYETKEMEVNVVAGQRTDQTVELKLAEAAPEPGAAPTKAPPPAEAPAEEAPPPSEPRSKVPAYVTLGVAGVSAAVGTFFGIRALSAKSDFDDAPSTDSADDVERNALIADMAFGVAITLGVTGVVLLTSSDSPGSPKEEARKSTHKARLDFAPFAGPKGGGAAARLTF
jgi:tetratricopeptide (TPR) repeat protein